MRKHALVCKFLIEPLTRKLGFNVRLFYVSDAQTKEGEKYMKFTPMKHNIEETVFISGLPLVVTHVIDEEVLSLSSVNIRVLFLGTRISQSLEKLLFF